MTLTQGRVNALGDDMSRAPHIFNGDTKTINITNLKVLNIEVTPGMSQSCKKKSIFQTHCRLSERESLKE